MSAARARRPRTIAPGTSDHVTPRGNRREPVFVDYIHFVLTPTDETGLARAVGEENWRCTGFIGARGQWTGHLFQARFGSVAMDEDHLMAALRYVPLNPVRAGLVARASDWPWSSARAHIAGETHPTLRSRRL